MNILHITFYLIGATPYGFVYAVASAALIAWLWFGEGRAVARPEGIR